MTLRMPSDHVLPSPQPPPPPPPPCEGEDGSGYVPISRFTQKQLQIVPRHNLEIEHDVIGMTVRSSSWAPPLGDCATGENVCANMGAGGSAQPAAASGERRAWFNMKGLGYARSRG